MSKISIREAINQVLHEEMARDERVVVMGEDVANRESGGVYGITAGLADKFGELRVIDTPITESAIIGAAGLAIGLAFQGTLSSIAAGVLLLILRPFKVGDVVDIGGTFGVVAERASRGPRRGGYRRWRSGSPLCWAPDPSAKPPRASRPGGGRCDSWRWSGDERSGARAHSRTRRAGLRV